MSPRRWKTADPLFRGDHADSVAVPDPAAKTTIVEHVLYLGGSGRPTPFSSTTESEEVAEYFAGAKGRVWRTSVAAASVASAKHYSREQLLQNLRRFGKGKAKWNDAFEVAQAASLVEQWSEHLLDWSSVPQHRIAAAVTSAFKKRQP